MNNEVLMRHPKKKTLIAASAIAALSATAFAATTPYDLIRPTWPLTWDAKALDNFEPNAKKDNVLPEEKTPANFKAGALMPDTLDQAYLDVINTTISPIRVNQAGYLKSDTERQFYFIGTAKEFEVVDENGKSLSKKITGPLTKTSEETTSSWLIVAGTDATISDHKRYSVEFNGPSGSILVGNIPQSVPTDKRLRIKVGDEISSTFIVSEDVYTMVKDAAIKFFGIQRSGNSDSWFHGPSHVKDGAGKVVLDEKVVSGVTANEGDLQGGWYDCGDYLKESQTQAYAFANLAVAAASNPSKDVDHYAYNHGEFVKTDNVPDVLREAKHGADFFLRSFKAANGVVDNMAVSVGNFGSDHGLWVRPELQDYIVISMRGGPADRDVRLGELGSNISGQIAAGLAILSKDYAKYDKDFADSCLMVAEKMYDFAKNLALGNDSYDKGKKFVYNTMAAGWSTPAYNGNNEYHDDLALAAIALHYATYEKSGKMDYLNDAVEDTEIGTDQTSRSFAFNGGWMAHGRDGMLKSSRNTSWANVNTLTLYAFYKLLLKDSKTATKYGISDEKRLGYAEKVASTMAINLQNLSNSGTSSIELPVSLLSSESGAISYDGAWYSMQTDRSWIYNRYQAGNIFEVLALADIAKDLEKVKLPTLGTLNWNSEKLHQLGINQLNYMLGVNPWDVSFIYGVGDKNDNHPHHRISNPEGRNARGSVAYKYVRPVGGLFGGIIPGAENSISPSALSWEDYHLSETCLDGSAALVSALTIVSNGGDDYFEKKCDNCNKNPDIFQADNIHVGAYHYEFNELDYLTISFSNSTLKRMDSVVTYVYFDATEDDVENCNVLFNLSICQAYDQGGFNKPCSNEDEIRKELRKNNPQKIGDTYDKKSKTYTWALPIVLDSLGIGRYVRLDLSVTSGTKVSGACEYALEPAKVDFTKGWSFKSHTASNSMPAYEGISDKDKDYIEIQEAPDAPYIVLRSQGKLIWGYGPADETSDRVGVRKIAAPAANAKMIVNGRGLYVVAPAQGTKTLKVFDMLGNQLMAQTFEGTSAQVSLAKLPHRSAMVARLMSGEKVLATKAFKLK